MAKRENIENYVGAVFTNLTIIKEGKVHITKGGNKHRTVVCKCACGEQREFQFSSIKNGHIKSCGCYSAKKASIRMKKENTKHGMVGTSEYNTWQAMKKRCMNKSHKSYKHYGGRGIKVCDEWISSFESFIKDMGLKPNKNLTLERVDNNKGYNKDNCVWATKIEQGQNQRTNNKVEYNGLVLCMSEWARRLNMSHGKLHYRLMIAKYPVEKAFNND